MEKTNEQELTAESIKFAQDYKTKKIISRDIFENTIAVNAAASGFYAGWRECEKQKGQADAGNN